jgi:hypothetical protein
MRSGSGSTDYSEDTSVVTTTSDPFSGNTSGGKTGSEIIAEGGAPESTVTSDPHETSVSEKFDDPKQAVEDMVALAHDGNDGDTASFDHVNDTEQGREDLKDSVSSIVKATTDAPENVPDDTPSKAETARMNAMNATPGQTASGSGGFLSALLGFVSSVVGAITSALGGN